MNHYIKNGIYPIDDNEIRRQNPNVSFTRVIDPAVAEEFGYQLVNPTERPTSTEGHVLESTPEERDGLWYQTWRVQPFSDAELDNDINARRAIRLDQGIEYEFPDGQTDRIQVGTQDLVLFMNIRFDALSRPEGDETPYQIFRTKTNRIYWLTAAQVIHLTDAVKNGINQIYLESWIEKDGPDILPG